MSNVNADVLIIGGGAAGLTAAVYCARAGMNTVVCESGTAGGKISSVNSIENFPAFTSVKGTELADRMREQALGCGAIINEFEKITEVRLNEEPKIIISEENRYEAGCVIIAAGSSEVLLDVKNEAKFHGKGIHYCAMCDGAMYKDKTVIVTGGGNSAVSAAIYLSSIAASVIMVRRSESFHCEKVLLDRMLAVKNIRIFYNWNITEILGDNKVIGVTVRNMKNNTQTMISADAVFAFNGCKPDSELFRNQLKLDEQGFIVTDQNMKTSVKGVYAAGDICSKECRQITTAVSDGTIAAYSAEKFVHGKLAAER